MTDIQLKANIVATSITSSDATLTITTSSHLGEQELIYPATESTDTIISSFTNEIGLPLNEPIKRQITEQIEISHTLSEFEFSLSLEGFKISIKRSPKKIVKSFLEK